MAEPAGGLRRRGLLSGAGAAVLASALPRAARAAEPEFRMKFASNLPLSHPLNLRMREAGDRITRDSGGRIVLQLFPSNQLGADGDLLFQLRAGVIELLAVSGLVAAGTVPVAALSGMGFLFPDYDAVWRAMDGSLGRFIGDELAAAELLPVSRVWDNGFRHMTTRRRPILGVEDLRGLKMRVPVSPLWVSMFRAFDATPTPIAPPELYLALQTGVADGQENALVAIQAVKLYEVQAFCALTRHMWDGYWLLANRRYVDALPPALRELVTRHVDEAALAQRADIARLELGARAALEQLGLRFNDVDRQAFRDKLRDGGFYREWRTRLGARAWGQLEQAGLHA